MRMMMTRLALLGTASLLLVTCQGNNANPVCPTSGVVDSSSGVGMYSSSQGFNNWVFTSYYDEVNGDLKLARYQSDTGEWTTETIDADGDVGQFSSIAVAGPMIYVSYYDHTQGKLKVAINDKYGDAANWQIKTINPSGSDDMGLYSSLVVAQQQIYVSYHNATTLQLGLARSLDSGKTWTLVTVDDAQTVLPDCPRGRVGLFTSIAAIDSAVHIAYYDASPGCEALMWAGSQDQGNTWTRAIIAADDPTGIKGRKPGVATYPGDVEFRSNAISARAADQVAVFYSRNGGVPGQNIYLSNSLDAGKTWTTSQYANDFDQPWIKDLALGVVGSNLFAYYYDGNTRLPLVRLGGYSAGGDASLSVETDGSGSLVGVKPLDFHAGTGRFGAVAALNGGQLIFTFYDEDSQQLRYACANYQTSDWP